MKSSNNFRPMSSGFGGRHHFDIPFGYTGPGGDYSQTFDKDFLGIRRKVHGEQLIALARKAVSSARIGDIITWSSPEDLGITLLGQLDTANYSLQRVRLIDAERRIAHDALHLRESLSLRLGRVSILGPDAHKALALVPEEEDSKRIQRDRNEIMESLQHFSPYPIEGIQFTPHVTIGRLLKQSSENEISEAIGAIEATLPQIASVDPILFRKKRRTIELI